MEWRQQQNTQMAAGEPPAVRELREERGDEREAGESSAAHRRSSRSGLPYAWDCRSTRMKVFHR